MKTLYILGVALATAFANAEPTRVAILDFEDQTGQRSAPELGGLIEPGAMAQKGVFALGKQLANNEHFVLVDRRDFIQQIEKTKAKDAGEPTVASASFIHAAQALNADIVLRGSLLSLSSGKQQINQGGYNTEFTTLSLRIALEALDAKDGTVISVADGLAQQKFRQTDAVKTTLSEDEILALMENAIAQAVPDLEKALSERADQVKARPTIKLSIKTSADPAMVEIDGLLVGTTPLDNYEVYQGDHVLSVGKPGYQEVTKRILFQKDTAVEIPLLRTDLTADELKDVLDKIELKVIQADPGIVIHTLE